MCPPRDNKNGGGTAARHSQPRQTSGAPIVWPAILAVVLGIWLVLAPFVLGTDGEGLGLLGWSHIIAGLLVVVVSALILAAKTGRLGPRSAGGVECEELAEC